MCWGGAPWPYEREAMSECAVCSDYSCEQCRIESGAQALTPFDRLCADALADEVAALVRRGVLDSRSPAADALLDYRDPPSSPRADRLAEYDQAAEDLAHTMDRMAEAAFHCGNPDRVAAFQAAADMVRKYLARRRD